MIHTLLRAVHTPDPQNATGTSTGYSVLLLRFRVTYHSAIPTGNYLSTWNWGTATTKALKHVTLALGLNCWQKLEDP